MAGSVKCPMIEHVTNDRYLNGYIPHHTAWGKTPRQKRHELLAALELADEKLSRKHVLDWILLHGVKNEKDMPMEFVRHAFLRQIYEDMSPRLACMKSSQVGFSTMAVLKVFWAAKAKGWSTVYTLPTDGDVKKFVHSKIDPIIEKNPSIHSMISRDVDNMYLKRIGNSHVFWEGTGGISKGIMVTADLLVHDELDRSDQDTVETYESRIQYSNYKGRWIFSNPSRPKVSVDLYWQRSDKKQWHIHCSKCGERQPLDYFVNVCQERREFICRKCREVLPPETRLAGEWVPEFPGRDWSGYHISQLIAPWITAAEIIEAEQEKTQEYFYNFVLGLPVIGGANQVSRSIILQCCTEEEPVGRWKLLGVDVGKNLHCVQGTENGITRVFTLDDWSSLNRYVREQGINLTVVDNAPEFEDAAAFCDAFRGRAYRCIYDYDHERKDMIEWSDIMQTKTIRTDKEGVVWAHRTRIIDHVISAFDSGQLKVYLRHNDPQLVGRNKPDAVENCLCDHWETLYTAGGDGQDVNIVKKDRMGNVLRTWENSGPDHFAHATVYYEIARQRKAPKGRIDAGTKRIRAVPATNKFTGY